MDFVPIVLVLVFVAGTVFLACTSDADTGDRNGVSLVSIVVQFVTALRHVVTQRDDD